MTLQAACDALLKACTAAGLQLRKMDKRAEKALVQEHRAALREQLGAVSEPAEALTLIVPLLIAQARLEALLLRAWHTEKPVITILFSCDRVLFQHGMMKCMAALSRALSLSVLGCN